MGIMGRLGEEWGMREDWRGLDSHYSHNSQVSQSSQFSQISQDSHRPPEVGRLESADFSGGGEGVRSIVLPV